MRGHGVGTDEGLGGLEVDLMAKEFEVVPVAVIDLLNGCFPVVCVGLVGWHVELKVVTGLVLRRIVDFDDEFFDEGRHVLVGDDFAGVFFELKEVFGDFDVEVFFDFALT